MDAILPEFVSAGRGPGSTFGVHAPRHAWNSESWRGGRPHGTTWPHQRGGGGQPDGREHLRPSSRIRQQRRGSFSRGGRNAKRIPGVGARRRGAPRCCPLLLGGRKRGYSCSTGHARDIDSRAHGGGSGFGNPNSRYNLQTSINPYQLRVVYSSVFYLHARSYIHDHSYPSHARFFAGSCAAACQALCLRF